MRRLLDTHGIVHTSIFNSPVYSHTRCGRAYTLDLASAKHWPDITIAEHMDVVEDMPTCVPCLGSAQAHTLPVSTMPSNNGPKYGLCIDCLSVHPYDEECQ